MRIAVLGTGTVGQVLAQRFAELGHDVVIGTRDPAATTARAPAPDLPLETFARAAAGADLVVNAVAGAHALTALRAAGDLAGVVLLDVSNPLDFTGGFPPTLLVKDSDSLGEQIQAAFPQALVVKTLNTVTAELMVHPERLAEGRHSVFVSGNDLAAKRLVTGLLESMGHTDVLDLGDITTARGTEMYLPLWLRLMQSLGTGLFSIRVVR